MDLSDYGTVEQMWTRFAPLGLASRMLQSKERRSPPTGPLNFFLIPRCERRFLRGRVVAFLERSVLRATQSDPLLAPFGRPNHIVLIYPVVRLALEAPVAYGWAQRDGFTIEDQLPIS